MSIRQVNIDGVDGLTLAPRTGVSFAPCEMSSNNHQATRSPHRPARSGFTLMESLLAISIVGTGVLALLAAQQAFHKQNNWAAHSSSALLLANELRELTLQMPLHDPITGSSTLGPEVGETGVTDYDDVDDFAGVVGAGNLGAGLTFDPPINALRQPINDMAGWSQVIEVEGVDPTNISADAPQPLGATSMLRVRVTVRYQSPQAASPQTMAQLTWVVGG